MKKKLILLVLLLLLTGCKAKYDLKLNFDGTVTESGTIYINSNLLGKNDYPGEYKEFLEKISEEYNLSKYRSKKSFSDSDYFGYNFSHKYGDARQYSNQSQIIKILFGGLSVKESNHYVTWKTTGENKIPAFHDLKKDTPTYVENINITITLPYRVVKHNATRVDTATNTYTWVFSGTTNSHIDLEFRNNELYTTDVLNLFKFVSWYIYFTILILIIALIIFLNAKTNSNLRNRI